MADHRTGIERAIKSRKDKKEDYVLRKDRAITIYVRFNSPLKPSRLIVNRRVRLDIPSVSKKKMVHTYLS